METGSILDRKRSCTALMKRLLMLFVQRFIEARENQLVLHYVNLISLEAQFIKFYINNFGSMLTNYKLFKLLAG